MDKKPLFATSPNAELRAILSGERKLTSLPCGDALSGFEVGPKRITLVGGEPGSGKTTLLTQAAYEAARLNPALRVLVCNVEMPPSMLLGKQLARIARVPLSAILKADVRQTDRPRVDEVLTLLDGLEERVRYLEGPFTADRITTAVRDHQASLVIADYIQRIEPPGRFTSLREKTNALMGWLRNLANCGVAVLCAAALSRTKDAKGRSTYDGKFMTSASFRESSELEYGADDAYLLHRAERDPDPSDPTWVMSLRCVKARYGETRTIGLVFDRNIQEFRSGDLSSVDTPKGPTTSPCGERAAGKSDWNTPF